MMTKETVSTHTAPAMSAGMPKGGSSGSKTGPPEPASKGPQGQDRIAQRAYELYEQRGRQDGRALEDWLSAERQLVGAASQS